MRIIHATVAAACLAAAPAFADDTGFYAGAGVGWSQLSIHKAELTNEVMAAAAEANFPLDTWSAKTDDSDINWSGFVGYRFMKYLAVEAGYLDTGTGSYTGRGSTPVFDSNLGVFVSVPVKGKAEWNSTGWPVTVLGIWPFAENWDVFGRVGGFFGEVRTDLRVAVYDPVTGDPIGHVKAHDSGTSNEFIYGIGVDGRFLGNWGVRFEWVAIPSLGDGSSDSMDWNSLEFSLLYRF